MTACSVYSDLEDENSPTGHGSKPKTDRLSPVDYDADTSTSRWDSLNERSHDSRPLTVSEVFGRRKSGAASASSKIPADIDPEIHYTRQGSGRLDSDCAQAVWGERLKTALQSYGCTQVLRGVYADESTTIVAHISVFNLRDVTSANKLLGDLDPAHHEGFVKPLPGHTGPFGSSYTAADATAYGHYAILSWVGYTDGAKGDVPGDSGVAAWSELSRNALEQAFLGFLDTRR